MSASRSLHSQSRSIYGSQTSFSHIICDKQLLNNDNPNEQLPHRAIIDEFDDPAQLNKMKRL